MASRLPGPANASRSGSWWPPSRSCSYGDPTSAPNPAAGVVNATERLGQRPWRASVPVRTLVAMGVDEHSEPNNAASDARRLLTAAELAARWQVPESHVYRLTRRGALPVV